VVVSLSQLLALLAGNRFSHVSASFRLHGAKPKFEFRISKFIRHWRARNKSHVPMMEICLGLGSWIMQSKAQLTLRSPKPLRGEECGPRRALKPDVWCLRTISSPPIAKFPNPRID
jgi:hypothetical protein